MLQKARDIAEKYNELTAQLSDPDLLTDGAAISKISRERAKIEPVARIVARIDQTQSALEEARETLSDPDLGELAREEITALEPQLEALNSELEEALLPRDEDADRNGEANEDSDDSSTDVCDGDSDDDGEADEDEGDLTGAITSFDAATGTLVVTSTGGFTITGTITGDTEIEFEEADGDDADRSGGSDDSENSGSNDFDDSGSDDSEEFEDRDATTADLQPGVRVAELEYDDDAVPGTLEEVQIYQDAATAPAV